MEKARVRIKKLPASYGVQTPPRDNVAYPGGNYPEYGSEMDIRVKHVLPPTDPENATLEAELGETVITNLQGDGIPEFFTIGGKRHYNGGTPLNLPPNSFIFSRDKDLKVKNPEILKLFNKTGKKGMTPADISKQYDINRYREILANPFSDKLQRETAELMIKNYNLKLGSLALIQEAKKGFDRGIPAVAIPYMEHMGILPNELLSGANPSNDSTAPKFKKGGATGGKRRVKVYFQKGGGTDEPVTRTQTLPKGAVKWDPNAPGYNPADVQAGDYVLIDGIWKKVTGHKKKSASEIIKDQRLGAFEEDYSLLVEKFKDQKFRDAFVEQYRKEIAAIKPKGIMTQKDIDEAAAMSPDDIINTFLYKQKVNLAINQSLGDLAEEDKQDAWDRNDPNQANDYAAKLGFKPLNRAQVIAFQTGYVGLQNLSTSDEYKDDLSDFGLFQVGLSDEPGGGTGLATISDIDGWDGNTTSGQVVLPRDSDLVMENVPYDNLVDDPEVKHLSDNPKKQAPAKWWTQDLVNLSGALDDLFGLKKYQPWQATPEYVEATPTFTDFRGTAARIGSQGAGLAESAMAFGNPNAFGAIAANIQRGMVDPILQTQEAENRANVGIANQFAMYNAQQRNQYNQLKADQDTQLYDKTVIANQQFDNSKRALKWNVRDMFNRGWTNKGMTQTLNALHDNYAVDPKTGYIQFTGDTRSLEPSNDSQSTFENNVFAIKNKYPDITWDQAVKIAKGNSGIYDQDYPPGVDPSMWEYPGSYPGQQ